MIEEKNSSGINDFSEKPHINIEHIDPAQLKTYKEFRDFQLIGQILFQWEAQRLDKQSGKDHPRVRLFKERLKQKKAFLADVEVELEIARIKVPKVSEDGALIHGRICDEKNRGLARLIVIMVNKEDQPMRFLGQSETDASGYFSFVIDAEQLKKLARLGEMYTTLTTHAGRVVHRKPESVKVAAGDRIVINMHLHRADLYPIGEDTQPISNEVEDTQPPPGIWTVRGRVTGVKGMPLSGLTVSLFDKDLIFDDRLGGTVTDEKGNFEINNKAEDFRDLLKSNPDLYITVRDREDQVLYSSRKPIRFEAGREEVIHIRIRNRKGLEQK